MRRFYRYVIYRLYTSCLKGKDITPVATVIFIMSFVHFAQMLILYSLLYNFIPSCRYLLKYNKTNVIIFLIIFVGLYYLFFYNKKRWNRYIEEFKNESLEQRRKGTIWVGLFTVGSVVLLFITMISLSIIFWPSKPN